jgi:hypothetical protein
MSSVYPPFGPVCQSCRQPLQANEAQCRNCGFFNGNGQPQLNNPATPPPQGMSWGNGMPPSVFGSGQYASGGQQWGQPSFPGQPAPNSPFTQQPVSQVPFAPPVWPNSPFGSPAPTQWQAPPSSPSQPLSGQLSQSRFQQPQSSFPAMPAQSPNGGFQLYGTSGLLQPQQSQQPQPVQQAPQVSFPLMPPQSPGFSGPYSQQNANGMQQSASDFPPIAPPAFNSGFQGNYQPAHLSNISSASLPDARQLEQKSGGRRGLIVGIVALIVILLAVSVGGYVVLSKSGSPALVPTPAYTPAPTPTGTPLFSDQFDNNTNGWDLSSSKGQYSVNIGNGAMTLEDDNNHLLWEIIPGGRSFSNFYLTVDAVLSKGTEANGYGIYIRGSSNQSLDIATYYRFELYGDGTYAIFKGTVDASGNSNSVTLVDYTQSSAILTQGKVNQISINANGPTLSFYVNGHLIKYVNDNTYASGSIAMFVSNLPNSPPGAQAQFSHLIIYPAQQ